MIAHFHGGPLAGQTMHVPELPVELYFPRPVSAPRFEGQEGATALAVRLVDYDHHTYVRRQWVGNVGDYDFSS